MASGGSSSSRIGGGLRTAGDGSGDRGLRGASGSSGGSPEKSGKGGGGVKTNCGRDDDIGERDDTGGGKGDDD